MTSRPRSSADPTPFSAGRGGVRVAVRLTPKASADAVDGVALDAAGTAWLKVRVTAPPAKGAANAALLKLLARHWGMSRSRLKLVAGDKDRRKTVLVEDADRSLLEALERAR